MSHHAPRYVIYGAGAVGGVIAGHLHRAGSEVTVIARGEHLERILANGLLLDTGAGTQVIKAAAAPSAAGVAWSDETVVILSVKSHQTLGALSDLAAHAPPGTPIVCAQNGVANEREVLRHFAHTYAMTVMLPATHLVPGTVVCKSHPTPGILDLGRYPNGTDDLCESVARDLRAAGFAAQARPDIMAWKYRKLISNAVGDVATVLPDDPEIETLRGRVRDEGEAVLAAAGVPVVSQAQDRERRGDLLRSRAEARGPNSLGQSLSRGTSGIEVDYRAGEIVLLGRLHGVPTPVNERIQRAAHARLATGAG